MRMSRLGRSGPPHIVRRSGKSVSLLLAAGVLVGSPGPAAQAFGAAGLVAGSLPERLYRQGRSLRIYEGRSEVQRVIIADALGRKRP